MSTITIDGTAYNLADLAQAAARARVVDQFIAGVERRITATTPDADIVQLVSEVEKFSRQAGFDENPDTLTAAFEHLRSLDRTSPMTV